MIRALALVALLPLLGGCSQTSVTELTNALAKDNNPLCATVTLTTPWGTEVININRIHGCDKAAAAP